MVANDSTRDVLLVALAELGACSPRTLDLLAKRLQTLTAFRLELSPDADDAIDALDALVTILHAIAHPNACECDSCATERREARDDAASAALASREAFELDASE